MNITFLPVFAIIFFFIGFIISSLYYEFVKKTIPNFIILILGLSLSIFVSLILIKAFEIDDESGSSLIFVIAIVLIIPFYLGAVYLNKRKTKKDK